MAPQATETFSDAISPNMGKLAFWLADFRMELDTPLASFPITIAVGFFRSIS